MFWYCQNVCFGEVCWWIVVWHVENYWTRIFAHHQLHFATTAKIGHHFLRPHIYVWMNWCWLMMIDDSASDDNANLGPCIFALTEVYDISKNTTFCATRQLNRSSMASQNFSFQWQFSWLAIAMIIIMISTCPIIIKWLLSSSNH